MKLNYTDKWKVNIDMREYLEKILDELPNKFKGSAATPTANHWLYLNTNYKKLIEYNAQLFQAMVAKILFLNKHSCPDILTTI